MSGELVAPVVTIVEAQGPVPPVVTMRSMASESECPGAFAECLRVIGNNSDGDNLAAQRLQLCASCRPR